MKCPRCNAPDTKVVDSRISGEGVSIRRRRECVSCAHRFTTYEQLSELGVSVIKRDGSRTPFTRDKIISGVEKACYKRPVGPDRIRDLAAAVEADVVRLGESEVAATVIGEMVMDRLRALDDVAYIRFASVYRNFKDVSDFAHEIGPMLSDQNAKAEKKAGQ